MPPCFSFTCVHERILECFGYEPLLGGDHNGSVSILFPHVDLRRVRREASGYVTARRGSGHNGSLAPSAATAAQWNDTAGQEEAFASGNASFAERSPRRLSSRDSNGRGGGGNAKRQPTGQFELDALQTLLADIERESMNPQHDELDLLCRMADLRREMIITRSLRHPRRAKEIQQLQSHLEMLLEEEQERALLQADAAMQRRVRESSRGVSLMQQAQARPRIRRVSQHERTAVPQRYLSFNTATFYESGAPVQRMSTLREVPHRLRVDRTRGDGRCLFRSIARGLAHNAGLYPGPLWNERRERREADILRCLCVREIRHHRPLFLRDHIFEDNFDKHLRQLLKSDQYAGEPELLVLGPLLQTPICVYVESGGGASSRHWRRIAVYGRSFVSEPLHLRYSNVHYDLLLPETEQESDEMERERSREESGSLL